jgi:hypothetical protein
MNNTLIRQAADRMVDAINTLVRANIAGDDLCDAIRWVQRARNDYQDACDLDELPPMQEARIRGSVPWNVGRG